MTIKEIEKVIQKMQDTIHDNEVCHILEDELREKFIKYLAKRNDIIGKKAKLILSTNDMDFDRWTS